MASLIFLTSANGGLINTDGTCAAAGGLLVIDTIETLPHTYSIASSHCRFAGGSVTLGSYNLTVPAATYADPYDYIFIQSTSGGGQVFFGGQTTVSPCWWGADPTGNSLGSAELLTYNAFQWAEIAIDGQPDSVVYIPPGHYILNAAQAVLFRYSHHIGKPKTVRLDFDYTTIGDSNSQIALFAGGNPNPGQRQTSGQKLPGWTAGTDAPAHNCNFLGAMDPTTCLNGNVWYGIDIVHDPNAQGQLEEGYLLIGLYLTGAFNQLIANSNFIGMPNDGVNIWRGSGTMLNVEASLNGFYGGAFGESTTRNGATFAGWFDIRTPALTTDSIKVVNCRFKANANSGVAPGGCSNDTLVDGCTTIGNGTIAYEFILYKGEDITQYQNSISVAVYDLLYVPAQPFGGNVWQCVTPGTTAATGSGPWEL